LNRDDIRQVELKTPFTRLDSLWAARTILAADVVVSMPKVKTYHWAGVTLSLKNMFGTIPGSVYGGRRTFLHWKGIDRSILDINTRCRCISSSRMASWRWKATDHFRDLVAADFTCARFMGFDPYRISNLSQAAQFLGIGDVQRDQLGERLPRTVRPFSVLPEFAHLIDDVTSMT
jgi:uncharacterized protein (DUF362 family)